MDVKTVIVALTETVIVGDCDFSDVNGVIICVKVGKVPVETQQFQHATPNAAVNQPPTNYMQR